MKNNLTQSDIFDLNPDNLPPELAKELSKQRERKKDRRVLHLFDIKNPLSVNEVLVGIYRQNEIIVKRAWVGNMLYQLTKEGLLKKITAHPGRWEKV